LDFILNFSEWIEYKHKVKAILSDGTYVTLPVNNETKKIVGKNNIVEIFYRPYSEKMWDMKLEELNPDIINRVPIRNDFNEYYFPNDKYQLLPKNGYTNFIKNMLDHQNINVQTNKFFNKKMETEFDYIFNSMPIDEYYNFKYGKLDYRSMKFHNYDFPSPKLLPVAQVNFTNKGVYTRMTEWKNLPNHGINEEFTTITFEEPCSPEENNNEKYYPVKDLKGFNRSKYMKYKKIKNDKVEFIGRLGLYSYLNMDQCINIALKTSEKYLKKQ
jgi:UDP-galactopyranose mutase